MCPACLATAAVIVVSTTSAGGLAALAVKKLRVDRRVTNPKDQTKIEEHRNDESC